MESNTTTQFASDQVLLARFLQHRSEQAFAELVGRHAGMVRGACCRLLGNSADAEDAVQSVFVLLWQKAPRLAHHPSLASWLHQAARNVCRNKRRTRATRFQHERKVAESKMHETSREPLEASWTEIREVLDELVAGLPEKLRLPILLFYFEGHTTSEVATILNANASTVGTWLQRARAALSAQLKRRGVAIGAGSLGALLAAHATAEPASAATATSLMEFAASAAGRIPTAGGWTTYSTLASVIGRPPYAALAATLLLAAAFVAWNQLPRTTPPDLLPLQGAWQVVAAEQDGKALPAESFEEFQDRIVIEDQRFHRQQTAPDGRQILADGGTITVDPRTTPAHLDIHMREGTIRGIYRLEGDILQICITREGGPRPDSFTTQAQDNRVLQKLQRTR